MKRIAKYGFLPLVWIMFLGGLLSAETLDAERLKSRLEQSRDYEFGDSRLTLTEIHNQIAAVYESPEELKKAETVLLEMLRADSSFALKDFICRQLSVMGTGASVPVLLEMLAEEKTAPPALYALVRIPSETVEAELLKALPKTTKPVQIGILSVLGMRKTAAATAGIAPLLDSEDKEITAAAISALGQIGTAEAAAAIEKYASRMPASLRLQMEDALLACGENLIRKGDLSKAETIFRKLYADGSFDWLRQAALRGLVHSIPAPQAEAILLDALKKPEMDMQTTAIRLACQMPAEKVLKEARQKMADFSPLLKIRFLAALTEYKRPMAGEAALALLDSTVAEVRLAAFQTLAETGDQTCVMPLARAAANAADRSQQEAARRALSRLPDRGADQIIVDEIKKADLTNEQQAAIAAELIRAADQRKIRRALPAIVQAAFSDHREVRRQALTAVQTLAGPDDLPQLVSFLKNPDPVIEKTLVIVALKEKQRNGRGQAVLHFLQNTNEQSAKAAACRVLGQIGDPDSLEALRQALRSEQPAVREAAFRGMTEWPGPEVMDDMKRFVTEGETETTRVLAFRAYIRMARQTEMTDEERAAALAAVMEMAPRESEKKIVLAALSEQAADQALMTAVKCLENRTLQAEAQASVIGICEKLIQKRPGLCKTALTKLLQSDPSEPIQNRANELLQGLKLPQ